MDSLATSAVKIIIIIQCPAFRLATITTGTFLTPKHKTEVLFGRPASTMTLPCTQMQMGESDSRLYQALTQTQHVISTACHLHPSHFKQ
jgi:hypothetical protein